MKIDEMLQIVVADGSVSDADIKRVGSNLDGYELTFGYGGCTQETIGALSAALGVLRERLRALKPPRAALTGEQVEAVERASEITRLECHAQDAEDAENLGRASELRAKARALRAVAQ